jgi:hypothetical protein
LIFGSLDWLRRKFNKFFYIFLFGGSGWYIRNMLVVPIFVMATTANTAANP